MNPLRWVQHWRPWKLLLLCQLLPMLALALVALLPVDPGGRWPWLVLALALAGIGIWVLRDSLARGDAGTDRPIPTTQS